MAGRLEQGIKDFVKAKEAMTEVILHVAQVQSMVEELGKRTGQHKEFKLVALKPRLDVKQLGEHFSDDQDLHRYLYISAPCQRAVFQYLTSDDTISRRRKADGPRFDVYIYRLGKAVHWTVLGIPGPINGWCVINDACLFFASFLATWNGFSKHLSDHDLNFQATLSSGIVEGIKKLLVLEPIAFRLIFDTNATSCAKLTCKKRFELMRHALGLTCGCGKLILDEGPDDIKINVCRHSYNTSIVSVALHNPRPEQDFDFSYTTFGITFQRLLCTNIRLVEEATRNCTSCKDDSPTTK